MDQDHRYDFGFKVRLYPCSNNCCWSACVEGEYRGHENGLYIEDGRQWKNPMTAMKAGKAAMEDEDFMARIRFLLITGYYSQQKDCHVFLPDNGPVKL